MFFDNLFQTRSLENPKVPLSDAEAFNSLFSRSSIDVNVTEEAAMGVTAVWQAVNLIAGTVGHLPLHLYKQGEEAKEKATADPLYRVLHDYPNAIHTKPVFWRLIVQRMVLSGRAVCLIVRNKGGRVDSLVPLERSRIKIKQEIANGKLVRTYTYNDTQKYDSSEILDFCPNLKADGVSEWNPIATEKDALGLAIAVEKFAAETYRDGGVPPLALTMPASSPRAEEKASDQVSTLLRRARSRTRNIVPLPTGFAFEKIGYEPSKVQMVELREHQVQEVSRIFNVAPSLLFDLSHGTFANYEQQALSFAQNTIAPLVKVIEAELNAKLFGVRNTLNSVEFDLQGMLRGDHKARMESLRIAVSTGIMTPNEARSKENLPPVEGGDVCIVQGAHLPLHIVAEGGFMKDSINPSEDPIKNPNTDASE